MRYKFFAGMGAAVCMLFALGCSDPVNQQGHEPTPPDLKSGWGQVVIRVAQRNTERALYPDAALFSGYRLSFFRADESAPDITIANGKSAQVNLKAGTWTVVATAYAPSGQGEIPSARGSAEITVVEKEKISAEITLDKAVLEGGGVGTLNYFVEFPADKASSASLLLFTMKEGGDPEFYRNVNLLEEKRILSLPAGYYLMAVQISLAGGPKQWEEIVHIYPGMETKTPVYRYEGEEVPETPEFDNVAALASYLDGKPENTEQNPYVVKVGGVNLENTTSSGKNNLRALYKALSRYVALDLSASTGTEVSNAEVDGKAKIVSLILPETVTTINLKAFSGCASLVLAVLPGVTTIHHEAFNNCTKLEIVQAPNLTEILNETKNSYGAFNNCASLWSIPLSKVTKVGRRSFWKCAALTAVSLPLAVEIESDAFKHCAALTETFMPRVETIGDSAYSDCPALAKVILGAEPPVLGSPKIFSGDTPLEGIFVPAQAFTAYRDTKLEFWTDTLKAKVKTLP
jgi:hypothetical protein